MLKLAMSPLFISGFLAVCVYAGGRMEQGLFIRSIY